MHLPIFTLALSSTLIFPIALTDAIAFSNPAVTPQDLFPDRVQGRVVQRGGVQALQDRQALDIDSPRSDGLIPFAGGGPVIGKFVKPSFYAGAE
ncbi:hypothetical protein DID88_001973 [Monilinia fructigena]|uniref:Uncharacterized protein n=1 Tax=Monilinia fructigena TaxID=38457 RepID=A0A395IXM3_9HELO|nr:hypothetical protein DID88_001973 [Monilinia fructigena]